MIIPVHAPLIYPMGDDESNTPSVLSMIRALVFIPPAKDASSLN
jgi:hypothetical protein